jgi:hypothetical protein
MKIIDKLENYKDLEEVKRREEFLILEFRKTCNIKNDRDIVENGYLFSRESRQRMSDAQKGNTNRKGKSLSKESRLIVSKIALGRKKINNGIHERSVKEFELQEFLESGWSLGRLPLSEEHKEKLKEAWKSRKPDSEETKERKRLGAIKGWQTKKI